jgi:hypothetical protein
MLDTLNWFRNQPPEWHLRLMLFMCIYITIILGVILYLSYDSYTREINIKEMQKEIRNCTPIFYTRLCDNMTFNISRQSS